MKRLNWQIILGLVLMALSIAFYLLSYFIFRDVRDVFFYLIQDMGFLFIQLLVVTLVVDGLLRMREKRMLLQKLNMVIGTFYSEVGTRLLKSSAEFNLAPDEVARELLITQEWKEEEYAVAIRRAKSLDLKLDSRRGDLGALKAFVLEKRGFMLRLLENPNLLEHESFTDLLWAVFHLADELAHRPSLAGLPEKDYEHLSNDMKRACGFLISEWLAYMNHLRVSYPYLYSLAVRTNPFNPGASVIFK